MQIVCGHFGHSTQYDVTAITERQNATMEHHFVNNKQQHTVYHTVHRTPKAAFSEFVLTPNY